jgi:hypothetical protein
MVAGDTEERVGLQRVLRQAGGVPVQRPLAGRGELGQHAVVAGDGPG